MESTYDSKSKRVNVSLTLREANILQEVLSEYYATVTPSEYSRFASDVDTALCNLPAVILYWRDEM